MAAPVAVVSPVSTNHLGSGNNDVEEDEEYGEREVKINAEGFSLPHQKLKKCEKGSNQSFEIQHRRFVPTIRGKKYLNSQMAKSAFSDHGRMPYNKDNQRPPPFAYANDASAKKKKNAVPVVSQCSEAIATKQISSRLPAAQPKVKKPSPGIAGSPLKKQKVTCRFYANGFCKKGDSCRFLHVKDGLDSPVKIDISKEASSRLSLPTQWIREFPKFSSQTTATTAFPGNKHAKESSGEDHSGTFPSCSNTSRDHHGGTGGIAAISTVGSGGNFVDKIGMPCHEGSYHLLNNAGTGHHPLSSFGFASWIDNSHVARNILGQKSIREFGLQNIGLHSFAEFRTPSENNHLLVDSGVPPLQSKYSTYAWEPSMPFLPTNSMIRDLLSKELPQNAKGDDEKTGKRDDNNQFRSSFSDQGSSVKDMNQAQVGETAEPNILSASEANNKLSEAGRVEAQQVGHKDETVDSKGENQPRFESKALICFRGALAEYVKELVKPTWREGLMSKDAHKLIVKKCVDKVISTFHPHQIPATLEAANGYLSSSRPKLEKLVEGYIERYGKT